MNEFPTSSCMLCGLTCSILKQHVAHSMGLAVQDAAENLRHVRIIANAATSAALAALIGGSDPTGAKEALVQAREFLAAAEAQLEAATGAAHRVIDWAYDLDSRAAAISA